MAPPDAGPQHYFLPVETSSLLSKNRDSVHIIEELRLFFTLAWPVVATFVCEFLPGFFSVAFVGHLNGKEDLDATALATMYFNVFGMSLGVGMATAMDTLCSQANGAGEHLMIGVYLQRGVLILSALAAAVMLLNYYAADVLILLGQDPLIAHMAGDYCRVLLPGLPFFYLYEMLKKCLQSQQVVLPAMFIAGVSIVFNFLFCALFISVLGWGYIGAAFARTLGGIGGCLLLLCYTIWGGGLKLWWGGWDAAAAWNREGLWEWIALGAPGCLMFCLEWWAFELIAVMAGWLPDRLTALGANMVIINFSTVVYTVVYMGMGVATTVRIGNLLGEGRPNAARSVSWMAMYLGIAFSSILGTLIMLSRDQLPSLFSGNRDINNAVRDVLWVIAAYQLPDLVNCVTSSVLKGCGKQALGVKLYLIAYYALGVPLAYWLAFSAGYGLSGLWMGLGGGVSASACFMIILVFQMDWEGVCAVARVTTTAAATTTAGVHDDGSFSETRGEQQQHQGHYFYTSV